MEKAAILVSSTPEMIILKVRGRGIHANSEEVRRSCTQALDKNVNRIVFDLKECVGMDSTFMGIIGMLVRLGLPKKCVIEIRNSSEANYKNLCSLGLKSFFEFTQGESNSAPTRELQGVNMTNEQKARNIIDAHQELIDMNEANREQFEDIVNFLKENDAN